MAHFSWFTLVDLIEYDHILGAILVLIIIALIGVKFQRDIAKQKSVLPSTKFSLVNVFEVLGLDFLFSLFEDIFSSREKARKYYAILAGSFFFILFANLLGLIPGFLPPTGNISTTLGFSLLIFIMYNYYGFREHGISYLKHFTGPVIFLAPLMVVIELVSHVVRPISLSLRLFMNIEGDHMVLMVFSDLTHFIIPAVFFALGVFVAFLQAFIFTILSAIYIALAEEHSH